jgi:hypothetical protein
MSGFKLLAIRPLDGCDRRFLKNLKPGIIYKFYQDYLFTDRDGNEISKENNNLQEKDLNVIKPENSINIYSTNTVNINVSTIVGENGSGKSSLIDFYNTICYFVAGYELKTISLTTQFSYDKLKYLLIFSIEYLESLKTFLNNELQISKIEVEKIEENELKKYSDEIVGYIESLAINFHLNITSLGNKEKENELLILLLKYIEEGNNIHFVNFNFSLIEISTIFTELNRKLINRIKYLKNDYDTGVIFDYEILNKFNFQLFYQKGEDVICLEKKFNEVSFIDEKFFYSILLNYSIHSLNSNQIGKWIFSLFHKNDGYQTPLVINPYRDEGVINVNRELKLSVDRLLFNIIDQLNNSKEAIILSKYKFNALILKRKLKDRERYPFDELEFDISDYQKLLNFIGKNPYKFKFYDKKNVLDYSLGYLIKKFGRISHTYIRHFYNIKEEPTGELLERVEKIQAWQNEKTIELLNENHKSHVTRKFFQTYNFLKNYEDYKKNLKFINSWDLDNLIFISNDEILSWIDYIKQNILKLGEDIETEDILSNLFPNIFEIDIEFEYENKKIKLSEMSSGEQQYIFNIQTITYHINNLKTIKENKKGESKIRNYNHVNIILDEIELYYHPQFQKNLVKDIIDSIIRLKSLNDMKNFNILFLTHSPFILSDMQSSKVLKLNDGNPLPIDDSKTFGANIHDILANEFFLQDGFMGEFSKQYIINLIEEINQLKEINSEENFKKYLIKVEVIDEPFIKYKLIETLEHKYTSSYKTENIDLMIKRKEIEIEQLRNKKRNG